jgi:Holliday junction resolvase RusA-like endonuclease
LLKPRSAPKRRRTWPIGARSGDVDKLARSVLDSLTGVLFHDDAQVVHLVVSKDYGDAPGVRVFVADADAMRPEGTG